MHTLSSPIDYPLYRRRMFDQLAAKHGQAGYAVVHDQENDHEKRKPIEPPQANDFFFNERTGEPTSQPRFEKEKLSATDKKGKSESETHFSPFRLFFRQLNFFSLSMNFRAKFPVCAP